MSERSSNCRSTGAQYLILGAAALIGLEQFAEHYFDIPTDVLPGDEEVFREEWPASRYGPLIREAMAMPEGQEPSKSKVLLNLLQCYQGAAIREKDLPRVREALKLAEAHIQDTDEEGRGFLEKMTIRMGTVEFLWGQGQSQEAERLIDHSFAIRRSRPQNDETSHVSLTIASTLARIGHVGLALACYKDAVDESFKETVKRKEYQYRPVTVLVGHIEWKCLGSAASESLVRYIFEGALSRDPGGQNSQERYLLWSSLILGLAPEVVSPTLLPLLERMASTIKHEGVGQEVQRHMARIRRIESFTSLREPCFFHRRH